VAGAVLVAAGIAFRWWRQRRKAHEAAAVAARPKD
jgi:hypothetical protein